MQPKMMLCTAAGLSLLALAGCNSQPEATPETSTTTTTVITAPTTAPSTVVVHSAPPVIVSRGAKPAPAAKPTAAKPASAVKPTMAPKKAPAPKTAAAGNLGPIPQSATKLISEDIKIGAGPTAETGKKVSVHYTGTLTDGTQFDSSVGKAPFDFTLGTGSVIPGWDQGVVGMKVGGKRRLIIPADLAYGDNPQPGGIIKPGDTLVFTVELLSVQ